MESIQSQKIVYEEAHIAIFPKQFGIQVIAVLSTVIYTGIVTAILFWVTDKVIGVKATSEEETIGLDETQHGEIAYTEAE